MTELEAKEEQFGRLFCKKGAASLQKETVVLEKGLAKQAGDCLA